MIQVILKLSSVLLLSLLASAQTAPVKVACPKTLIRSAGSPPFHQSLSAGESAYIKARTEEVLPSAFKAYLGNVKAALPRGASLPAYVTDILAPPPPPSRLLRHPDFPKLGLALSGGGLRAAYFAAGVLTSLDARNGTHPTGTMGWFTTALVQANFPTIPDLVFPDVDPDLPASNSRFGGFLTGVDEVLPAGATGNNTGYFEAIVAELEAKHAAGFPVTITDAWSREVARHFVNGTTAADILEEGTHGSGILFSGLQNLPTIKSHAQPFPIILANAIPPALTANPNDPTELADIIPGNDVPVESEIWEFNLFETGSWDPSLSSFIPTHLLGSTHESGCVTGFDQASYIAGISSNVWNGDNGTVDFLSLTPEGPVLQLIEANFPNQAPVRMDAGPFRTRSRGLIHASNESFVALVDGGSNGEVCPLQPLIVRAREVDTIFAIDSADRTDSFTNGTDLITTASRAARFGGLYPFPKVPSSPDTFVNQNLTSRPTFFGCDEPDVPLVIYLANGAPSAQRRALGLPGITNVPTTVTTFSPEMAQSFMDESFAIATQGLGDNSTDPGVQWSTCLACALVDRARSRRKIARTGLCATCFTNFCWNGKE
ncbi:lysophospholipase [Gymnopilus junonius]|uniref:Lysophospholipase n=1 Tax=Gymnopilus junonius TaxID=109634 RepID=A0A9P5THX7_GYMJU|nr:lysophospholipase [Gymnopilus junonius]